MMRLLKHVNLLLLLLIALPASVIAAPQLLAFPHQQQLGATHVYSDTAIDTKAMRTILENADRRLESSPIYTEPVGTRIFLTDGGWRWRFLSLNNRGAFGFTRPISTLVSDAVIINISSPNADKVYNGRSIGGERKLSGVIAHERTHIMVSNRLGVIAAIMLPRWKSEGYAEFVAGDSALTAEQVTQLRKQGKEHPAIAYFQWRERVAAALQENDIDALALLTTE